MDIKLKNIYIYIVFIKTGPPVTVVTFESKVKDSSGSAMDFF